MLAGCHYYTSHDGAQLPSAVNGVNQTAMYGDGGIVAILDSDRKIDLWNVDNLTLDSEHFSYPQVDTDGDIIFNPNGSGEVMIPDDTKLGFARCNGTASGDDNYYRNMMRMEQMN